MEPDRSGLAASRSVAGTATRRTRSLIAVGLAVAACGPRGPVEEPELLAGTSSVQYPTDLWDAGMEGEAILMVRVTDAGIVDSAYVEESSGHAAFDSAAVRGSRDMRFTPATRGGQRIVMWTRLPIRFRLEATEPTDARVPAAAGTDTGRAGHETGHD
jgi:TonB family protein